MQVGRVVIWKDANGDARIGSVVEVKENSLLAKSGPHSEPVELQRGEAKKGDSYHMEFLVSEITGVAPPVVHA